MKKATLLLAFAIPLAAFSQSGVLDKMKQKTKARAEQRADEAMDRSIDKAENELSGKNKSMTSGEKQESNTATTAKTPNDQASSTHLKSYSRYDFVPGDRIVYVEDFSQDVVGEFPLKWVTNNRGETVTIETLPNQWMRLFPASNLASPALKKLPENFTLELDLFLQFSGEGGYVYPELKIKLLELLSSDAHARNYVTNEDAAREVALVLAPGGAGEPLNAALHSYEKGGTYFTNQSKQLKTLSDNNSKPIHIALWVQQERIRCWINSDKVFDIPQAIPAGAGFNRLGFSIESSLYTEDQLGMYVSNIKLAEGTPDLRSKLMTEGKWTTNGILFDVNSDRIKPESAGVLREIAAVLKENSGVKVKIVGHTDSDGEDKKNLDLSRRRAASIKNALATEFGIDPARMETDGLGETRPVAENTTKEGKAQNRRVEFIKL